MDPTNDVPGIGRIDGTARCDDMAAVRLYARNIYTSSPSDGMDFIVKVANQTARPIPMNSLAVRYYFTNELANPWMANTYYADTCCNERRAKLDAHVLVSAQPMLPKPTADTYLEFGFDDAAGDVAPGDAVQVEVAFHAPSFDRNLVQTNDYSFGTTNVGTQAEWDACPGPRCERFTTCAITVHQEGALVWGASP
jgi:hypothetical protein